MSGILKICICLAVLSGGVASFSRPQPDISSQGPHTIEIEQVDSVAFYTAKGKAPAAEDIPVEITSIEEVTNMLENVVYWGSINDDDDNPDTSTADRLLAINFRNGTRYVADDYLYFRAYYPQEDILLLEGGHSTDYSFNLTSAEGRDEVGNPQYICHCPSGKYRLTGYFGGQECSTYFIQQKNPKGYGKIIQLDKLFETMTGVWLCTVHDRFWSDDDTLFLVTSVWEDNTYKYLYYRIVVS